jgi:hypothetical protein
MKANSGSYSALTFIKTNFHPLFLGDNMGIEMELFDEEMSVAIFTKNYKPVGTRFLTLKDFEYFLPTIAVVSSGEEIEINVYWHVVVSVPPRFNVVRLKRVLLFQII